MGHVANKVKPETAPRKLKREAFVTNRAMEFFTEAELRTQIGHGRDLWPVVIAKGLIDNSLDACESADIAPKIDILLEQDALTITDNGPGLPAETIKRSLDYTVRVSDKKYYISPTRGQLGNALKCVWAAPFVTSASGRGCVEIIASGQHHTIDVRLNHFAQVPIISDVEVPFIQSGTSVKLHWPGLASYTAAIKIFDLYDDACFGKSLESLTALFAALNPHASFTLTTPNGVTEFPASIVTWDKWRASQPTSAHWYTPEQLQSLLHALIHHGGDSQTVRDFIRGFDGLRRDQYAMEVGELAGLSGPLCNLLKGTEVPIEDARRLLEAMKSKSTAITPKRLGGVIGKDHLQRSLAQFGATDEIKYCKTLKADEDDLPHVTEVAFGTRDYDTKRVLLNRIEPFAGFKDSHTKYRGRFE